MLSDDVPTPVPWLRFDAVAVSRLMICQNTMLTLSLKLNLVWVLFAFASVATAKVPGWAWKVAGCFMPISMGWAAGDVSLAAYIQSLLSESAFRGVSCSLAPIH